MRSTWGTPSAVRVTNQMAMTGPKNRPTWPEPNLWTEKRPARITSDNGITSVWKRGSTTERPSMADITEMAGVMRLSP